MSAVLWEVVHYISCQDALTLHSSINAPLYSTQLVTTNNMYRYVCITDTAENLYTVQVAKYHSNAMYTVQVAKYQSNVYSALMI